MRFCGFKNLKKVQDLKLTEKFYPLYFAKQELLFRLESSKYTL